MSPKNPFKDSRRKFIYNLGLTDLSAPALSGLVDCNDNNSTEEKNLNYMKEDGLSLMLLLCIQAKKEILQTDHSNSL